MKPCPFCGKTKLVISHNEKYSLVYCEHCACSGPYELSDKEAIDSWNNKKKGDKMNQKEEQELTERILSMPLSSLQEFVDGKTSRGDIQRVCEGIQCDAELAFRKSEYLLQRIWGVNHDLAVKKQNALLRKIRKALTKMITHDVTF